MSALSDEAEQEDSANDELDSDEVGKSVSWSEVDCGTDWHVNKLLIKKANANFSLKSELKKYGIIVKDSNFKFTKFICPFKDHNETTPSFSYYHKSDSFYCYGCQRVGRVVDFLSLIQNKDKVEVAKQLLSNNLDITEILSLEDGYNENVDKILFDFAKYVRDFINYNNKSKKAIKYSENINIGLDIYLHNMIVSGRTIASEHLLSRISKMKEWLESFEDNNE